MKALLVIWFFTTVTGNPMVTKFDTMDECNAARTALLQAFPRVDESWTTSPSGLRPEIISCVGY